MLSLGVTSHEARVRHVRVISYFNSAVRCISARDVQLFATESKLDGHRPWPHSAVVGGPPGEPDAGILPSVPYVIFSDPNPPSSKSASPPQTAHPCPLTHARARTHVHTPTHPQTHTRTSRRRRRHTHVPALTCAHARTHVRTHARTHARTGKRMRAYHPRHLNPLES